MQQHNITLNDVQDEHKGKQLREMVQYLYSNPATATQVAVALNIYRPSVCRRKRTLEKRGQLAEIRKVICPITKHRASLLTTDPLQFPKHPVQLTLL